MSQDSKIQQTTDTNEQATAPASSASGNLEQATANTKATATPKPTADTKTAADIDMTDDTVAVHETEKTLTKTPSETSSYISPDASSGASADTIRRILWRTRRRILWRIP